MVCDFHHILGGFRGETLILARPHPLIIHKNGGTVNYMYLRLMNCLHEIEYSQKTRISKKNGV
jgi:hypothetical protein